MRYYSADPISDYNRFDKDRSEWLRRCPVCTECGEPIQPGYEIYRIKNEIYCEDCIDNFKSILMEDELYE